MRCLTLGPACFATWEGGSQFGRTVSDAGLLVVRDQIRPFWS